MYRFAHVRQITAVLVLAAAYGAAPASAQDNPPEATPEFRLSLGQFAAPVVPVFEDAGPAIAPAKTRRPAALVPMYVSFASLQALDVHSTARALDRGAVESNPVMRGLSGNTAGMIAVKAAATAGVVYSAERIWKKNKAGAILFMVAANSAMGWVVQHNYRSVVR